VNKGTTGQITSDSDGSDLFLQDTNTTPHVDHRYPKSKGGSNSYTNAAVIPAKANIAKSDKLDLGSEPDTALPPYLGLHDPPGLMKGKDFSKDQKTAIYKANVTYYGKGDIVSDNDGRTRLEPHDSAEVPHIDHITPKSTGGSNYYFNARVISAEENIKKGGQRGGSGGDELYDHQELEMNLKEFIDYKQTGVVPARFAESSSSEEEEEPVRKKRPRSTSDPGPRKRGGR
jgi:5-methylcytosine-specific restriction endonuclease McrA